MYGNSVSFMKTYLFKALLSEEDRKPVLVIEFRVMETLINFGLLFIPGELLCIVQYHRVEVFSRGVVKNRRHAT